ncbi:MAG TPA: adenylate/guanylate cyclase domain-containing protein [Kofleriaceae bacterium]|nr:adenylate/guanylate cyclase domain-containing protein [Kofleriaceae bacterium]
MSDRLPVRPTDPPPTRAVRSTTPPSFDTKTRLSEVLDQHLDKNSRRMERWIGIGRVLALATACADQVTGSVRFGLPAAHITYILVAQSIVLAACIAVFLLNQRWRHHLRLMRGSVCLDMVAIVVLISASVRWPDPTYAGVLRMVELGIIPIAVIAAGCRLHRHLAVLSAILGIVATVLLIGLDLRWNRDIINYGVPDVLGYAVLFVAASVLAAVIAGRTRSMVFEAARLATRVDKARDRLRVYVSDEVATEALDGSADSLSLDGEQRHVAVLFSDLRDFTRYASAIDPKQLVAELNAYFDAMVPVIQAQGGVIDKFMGDAIMAVFSQKAGAPDVSARALAAAFDMRDALATHNEQRASSGRPPMRHGIGLHSGFVVAGNVGTQDRVQYTVIGDVVNVASRLEKATKELGTSFLCSVAVVQDARRAAGRTGGLPPLVSVGTQELRGVDGAVEIFAAADEVTARPAARR